MRPNALDPILAPALQMEDRPVVRARQFAQDEAAMLVKSLERIGLHLGGADDPHGQLHHIAESLGVMVIALMAYARGLNPKVESQKPNTNIIVQ